MSKRLAAVMISVLLLAFGFPGIALASHGDGDRPKRTSSIWEGLCVGASLDLSKASQIRCARKAEAARQKDRFVDKKPNIGAGLCVGASLDLSPASQAKCIRENPPPPDMTKDHGIHSKDSQIPRKDRNSPPDKSSTNKDEATPATPSQGHIQYAALGDSVAAGLGLANPVDSEEQCGRTLDSYVYQVASSRGLEVTNLACSGAKMGDLSTEQGVRGPNIPPQLDGAFAGGTPELMTITAGANDIHWQDFLRKCYARTCGTPRDERVASGLIAALDLKTQLTFQDIERRSSGSPPEVILTGYYIPLSDRCAEIEPRLTLEEISWLNQKTAELNQTLENAAAQSSFATFTPVDFTGHDICSDDPWIQVLDDPAPFHPTVEGQQAIARAIL